ncbi:hypothetical protein [Sediminicoccus sp. BL-A-41-H5]|uniref:hypothetical protein n=1 Tax=Sediminicoccus sp. BL-A-41-H5 TaxID=3421106 RepID=UPI003D6788C0
MIEAALEQLAEHLDVKYALATQNGLLLGLPLFGRSGDGQGAGTTKRDKAGADPQ